jgi:hypothetical protein
MKKPLILLILSTILLANLETIAQQQKAKISKSATNKKRQNNTLKSNESTTNKTDAMVGQKQPTPTTPQKNYQPSGGSAGRIRYSSGTGFNQSNKLLNVGVGLSSYYYGNPIGLSFESGVSENISVGGQFDYNSGNYDGYYGSSYRWGYSAYYLGIRGSYHVNQLLKINSKNVDLYAGVGLGYQRFRWDDESYGYGYGYNYNYRSGLFFNYFIGGKYYFTDKIGGFLELGYTGLSSARVGLAVKF